MQLASNGSKHVLPSLSTKLFEHTSTYKLENAGPIRMFCICNYCSTIVESKVGFSLM